MPFAHHSIFKASRAASTFLISAAWLVLSLAAAGEISRLAPPLLVDVTREAVAAALLFVGFYSVASMFLNDLRPLSNVGFVRRPGTAGEFARGLALGWGIAIALVLPALLSGNLSANFSFSVVSLTSMLVSAVTLVAFAFVVQLILGGLPVRTLLNATSPAWTATAVVIVAAMLAFAGSAAEGRSVLFAALTGFLFVTAFLRTRAVWLSLGLQLGWTLSLQLLFGASSPYTPATSGPVTAQVSGPFWLTGSPVGPEASMFAVFVLIAAIIVLYRLTKDYAWHYTWQPLEGAGHPMDVPPPEQHLREEARHAVVPLVQIGGVQSLAPHEKSPEQ